MNTMPVEGKIYYFGSDNELSSEISNFFTARSRGIHFSEAMYTYGSLISLCSSQKIDVIYIDFSEPGMEIKKLLHETLFLKRVGQFKSVLLVALFKDEAQKAENNLIFTSGFQISFIKGSETDALLRDSFYIGLRKKIEFPILALANKNNLPLEIGICSTITCMEKTEFRIETDIEGLKDKLKLNLAMFPELKCPGYEIKESHPPSCQYPMISGYTIGYPLAGPWVDDSEENIQPETIETWLDHSECEFTHMTKTYVRIYSNDLSITNELFNGQDQSIQINFGNDTKNLDTEIFRAKPSLVFVNLDDKDVEDEQVSLKILDFLLSVSFSEDYRPIIVVSNCSSTGPALQKAYNYPLIMATVKKLESELCLTMIKKFQLKRQERSDNVALHYFNPTSVFRSIDIFENFILTSLTEHEVTFISEIELPMFTVVHFALPIEFHATIVPSIMPLEKKNDKYHYMAFIHGLSEEQLMVLRKFVYQIIYSPLKDFSEDSVKKSLGEALTDKKTVLPPVVEEMKKESSPIKTTEPKKYIFSGKSKL